MKKRLQWAVFIMILLLSMNMVKAAECNGTDCFNGSSGGGGTANGTCGDYQQFCIYNGRYNKGIRVSLVYCDEQKCEFIPNINGDQIKTYHDYYYNEYGGYPSTYNYCGYTKTNIGPNSIIINDCQTNKKGSIENASYVNDKEIPIFTKGNDPYFNSVENFASDETSNNLIEPMLAKLGTSRDSLMKVMQEKNVKCNKEHKEQCPGFRILVEPIFLWANAYAKNAWILTPTEVWNIHAHSGDNDTYKMMPHNFAKGANSLALSSKDVYFNSWGNYGENQISSQIVSDNKLGWALNIINPLPDYSYTPFSCETIKSLFGWDVDSSIKNAYKQGKLQEFYDSFKETNGKIHYNAGKNEVDIEWYVNECTCYGMYDYFDNTVKPKLQPDKWPTITIENILGDNWYERLNDVNMTNYTPVAIAKLFNGTAFRDYDKAWQFKVDILNSQQDTVQYVSTPAATKYQKNSCGTSQYTCEHLKNWYNTNKPDYYTKIEEMTENDFNSDKRFSKYFEIKNMLNAYNAIYSGASGVTWTNELYYDKCVETNPGGDGEDDKKYYNCTPQYNVGTCINGDSISYTDANGKEKDEEYWQTCVFEDKGIYDDNKSHKLSQNGELSYYDENLGSTYCPVYCIENLNANFDKGNFTVKAGSNFVWGNSEVSGSRTCRTKEVKYDTFVSDLKEANEAIRKNYIDWQLEILKNESIKNGNVKADNYSTPAESCGTDAEGNSLGSSCECGGCKPYTKCSYTPQTSKVSFMGQTRNVNIWNYNDYSGHNASCKAVSSFVDTNSENTKKTTYENSLSYAGSLVKNMKACYEWDNDDSKDKLYNLDPILTLHYSDGYYEYSGTMSKQNIDDNIESNVDQCQNTTVDVITSCNGSSCTITKEKMKKCTDVTMTREITNRYSLSKDVYQYVLKYGHESLHASNYNANQLNPFTNNYTNIGYGNLPVAFQTKEGRYGVGQENGGELSIHYFNLGHDNLKNENMNDTNNTTAVDQILNVGRNDSQGKWECAYNVENGIIGRNKLIYRPIDLKDPFPDMDSTGRQTGSNWCYGQDCSSKNETVQKYILNNRNVTGEEIYQQTPMYTIILKPADILEIRKYNRKNKYDSYTGSLNGKNYDYVCGNGTGNTCISEYLTHIIDITNARNEPGTCVQDQNRNVNDSKAFENCRYE